MKKQVVLATLIAGLSLGGFLVAQDVIPVKKANVNQEEVEAADAADALAAAAEEMSKELAMDEAQPEEKALENNNA